MQVSWILKKRYYGETLQFFTGLLYESSSLAFDDNSGSPDSSSWRTSEGAPWVKHNPSGAGSCVKLGYNSRTWEWRLMDADCGESKPYICEITQSKYELLCVCLYCMLLFHLVLEISQSSVWLRKNIPEKAEI